MGTFVVLSGFGSVENKAKQTQFRQTGGLNIRGKADRLLSIRLSGAVEQKAIEETLDWRNDNDRAKNHSTKDDIETYFLPVGDSRNGGAALCRAVRSIITGEG
jgi:hypothetical protein